MKKKSPKEPFTGYQKFVVALLAFLQFTIILDFMILSPLGAILMPALQITPSQFGVVVSVYAFSAGLSGFLAAGFADRYDRKKLLLFFYTGFVFATFCCGIAPNYSFLVAARALTGIFGGVIGSIVFAIVTDLFPFQMRGRVMGAVQTAFAASQILGLPAGLFLSNYWGWHAPFLMIVAVSLAAGVVIWVYLKPIDAHLNLQTRRSPLAHLLSTVSHPPYLLGFCSTALLSVGGFMLMPFSSAFTVRNLGIPIEKLPLIYLITGLSSILIGPMVGRAADAFGAFRVFAFGTVLGTAMVLYYTHLGPSSLSLILIVNVVMFAGIFSRMIPAQALTSAIPSPESRGAYMSVGSSLQQISGGLASVVGGLIVVEGAGGALERFNVLGYVMAGVASVAFVLMLFVNRMIKEKAKA